MRMESFDRLVGIMERLRTECPWDREQTHETLKTYLIEEAYEVLESIDKKDDEGLKEELGDLQIQVLFHAICANERGKFYLDDIFNTVSEKLIKRHPHVFGEVNVKDSAEVLQNWEHIKKNERKTGRSMFESVPDILPALLKAFRVQSKAARVGFDWRDIAEIWGKIAEETEELRADIGRKNEEKIREELGDLLFAVVNLARYLTIDPEDALRMATDKFITRFHRMEESLGREGRSFGHINRDEMMAAWDRAKAEGTEDKTP